MLFSWCIPNSPFLLLFCSCRFPVILLLLLPLFISALLLLYYHFPFYSVPCDLPSRCSVVFLLSFSCLVILPSCSSLAFFLPLLSYYSPLLLRLDSLFYCCYILPSFSCHIILPSFCTLIVSSTAAS